MPGLPQPVAFVAMRRFLHRHLSTKGHDDEIYLFASPSCNDRSCSKSPEPRTPNIEEVGIPK